MEMWAFGLKQYNNRNKLCISLKHLFELFIRLSGGRGAASDDEDEKNNDKC